MQLTGHLDFNHLEARKALVEGVATLPVHQSEDYRRLIYVTGGGSPGFYIGGVSSWVKIETAGSAALTEEVFAYDALSTAALITDIYDISGTVLNFPSNTAGSLVLVEVFLSTPLTVGSLVIRPRLNGGFLPTPELDVTISGANPQFYAAVVAAGLFPVVPTDFLGVQVVGLPGNTPANLDCKIVVSRTR